MPSISMIRRWLLKGGRRLGLWLGFMGVPPRVNRLSSPTRSRPHSRRFRFSFFEDPDSALTGSTIEALAGLEGKDREASGGHAHPLPA